VISELLTRLYPAETMYQPRDEASNALRAAIENATGCPPGKTPTNRQVGKKLRSYRRAVVGGRYLQNDDTKTKHGVRWRVHNTGHKDDHTKSTGDSGDSGDSFLPTFARAQP
jgi:hypothetical protein